jgi:hypothetical protein
MRFHTHHWHGTTGGVEAESEVGAERSVGRQGVEAVTGGVTIEIAITTNLAGIETSGRGTQAGKETTTEGVRGIAREIM